MLNLNLNPMFADCDGNRLIVEGTGETVTVTVRPVTGGGSTMELSGDVVRGWIESGRIRLIGEI